MSADPWSVTEPPHDLAAEVSILGACLLSADALADTAPDLRPDDFYKPAHGVIFDACLNLFDRGEPADATTVLAELSKRQELAAVGGGPFIHSLIASVPSVGNVAFYVQRVRDQAVARRLVIAGQRITHLGQTDGDIDTRLEQARDLLDATEGGRSTEGGTRMGAVADALYDTFDLPITGHGMMTGWRDLDFFLNPLDPGQFVVIGARPSIGKSVAGLDLARECAVRLGDVAVIAALEQSKDEVTLRAIAAEAKVPLSRLQRHQLDDHDWANMANARKRITEAPLFIDDSGAQTLQSLRALVRRHKPRLLVVDYLGLVTPPQAANRREAIDALSRGMKLLAKSEGVIVVALSQLNRKAEDRHDKRPQMADLRESGGIEQDADVVILLHREDAYDPLTRPGEIDLIVAKQRNGPTSSATLTAQLQYSRFTDYAKGP